MTRCHPNSANITLCVQEYFNQTIGGIKKCFLTYGPDGKSRGSATIWFSKQDAALTAAKQLNGLKVDERTMKVEIILGPEDVSAAPAHKSLGDRIK